MSGDRAEPPAEAAAPSRRLLRLIAPWVVAAAILAFLLVRIPVGELQDALARTSLWQLLIVAIINTVAVLAADSLAMWIGFREAIPGFRLGVVRVIVMRGASYLLAIVNYGAGQGGVIYFLKRYHRVPLSAAAGAVFLTSGVFIIAIALVVGGGVLAGAVPDRPELRWLAIAVIGSIPVYLGIVALRPRSLGRFALLQPLFDAGVAGTIRIAAARGLHIAVLIAGHWAAMWVFDIHVPAATAMAGLPVVFLVAALPISPSGLGTSQAAAVTLFASYAPGASEAVREATVLAYSLSFQFVGVAFVAGIGLLCLRLQTRSAPGEEAGESAAAPFDSPAPSP